MRKRVWNGILCQPMHHGRAVKGVKKSVKGAIGEQVLSDSKLQTVFSEAANLVNERPIARHPTEP